MRKVDCLPSSSVYTGRKPSVIIEGYWGNKDFPSQVMKGRPSTGLAKSQVDDIVLAVGSLNQISMSHTLDFKATQVPVSENRVFRIAFKRTENTFPLA